MSRRVTYTFRSVPSEAAAESGALLEVVPRKSGIFRIFDVQAKLILLEKTHNLAERLERFYAEERETRALDLREITGRIEYCLTDSPFESLYLLQAQRRHYFPDSYHRMRTFPPVDLLKINRKQRFPRIYRSRQVRAGAEYFGPFRTRGEFELMKASLERAFRLRPCEYNIRGDDPYPDCLYFQMRTCSKPCNADITRKQYLEDVADAIRFLQGQDSEIRSRLLGRIHRLSEQMRFEEATAMRRRIERLDRARKENQRVYFDVTRFQALVVMRAGTTRKRKIAFVRRGEIVSTEEHAVAEIGTTLTESIRALDDDSGSWKPSGRTYEDFCLVAHFMNRSVQSVVVIPWTDAEEAVLAAETAIRKGTRKAGKKARRRPDPAG